MWFAAGLLALGHMLVFMVAAAVAGGVIKTLEGEDVLSAESRHTLHAILGAATVGFFVDLIATVVFFAKGLAS